MEVTIKIKTIMDDKIIRVIAHVDTSEHTELPSYDRKFFHEHQFCANEESAVHTMNVMLRGVLDDDATMASVEDLPAVNAALAEQYDEPYNINAYASIEDITEEVIIKCSELFCEHHWSHKALMGVVEELGIDLYDIEKA